MRKNNRKAFTLLETMLTVAIIAILSTIAIVSINAIIKNTRQSKLDSLAQIMYVSAQDRLTEMEVSGTAYKLAANGTDTKYVETVPSDWFKSTEKEYANAQTAYDANYKHVLAYITSNSSESLKRQIFPVGSIEEDLYNMNWVVEYDIYTGIVYSVFFAEPYDSTTDVANFYTNEVANGILRVSKKKRIDDYDGRVGYYAGDRNELYSDTGNDLSCFVEVKNGEELTVDFITRIPKAYSSSNIQLSANITGLTSGKTAVIATGVTLGQSYGATTRTVSYTLDSLISGKSFNDLYSLYELVPGEDIDIQVTVASDNAALSPSSNHAVTNSLFAEIKTAEGSSKSTAYIACGRHLQNLNTGTSGLSKANSEGSKVIIERAVQTNDIDFESTDWTSVYNDCTFNPINNPYLTAYTGVYTYKDDINNTEIEVASSISNITIDTKGNAGLFASFDGTLLDHIVMIDSTIYGSSDVGVLAGYTAGNVTIRNCQVHLTEEETQDKSALTDTWVKGNNVGGLVGTAGGNLFIYDSAASTVLYGDKYGGGLVGTGHYVKVDGCYADCYIKANTVGGLIAYCTSSSEIAYSYSVGFLLNKAKAVGGITPCNVTSLAYVYSVFDYTSLIGENNYADESYSTVKMASKTKNVYYSTGDGNHIGGSEYLKGSQLRSLETMSALLNGGTNYFSSETNVNKTTQYQLSEGLTIGAYPYPSLAKLDHYGDWGALEFEPGRLVYFEYYGKSGGVDQYGFYGPGSIDTLRNDTPVLMDGYALLYHTGDTKDYASNVTVYLNDNAYTSFTRLEGKANDNVDYWFRCLPADFNKSLYNNAAVLDTEDYLLSVRVEAQVTGADKTTDYYEVNPLFGRAIYDRYATVQKAAKSTVYIRSPRHLYNLSLYYSDYRNNSLDITFKQEYNLNYDSYMWSDALVGITYQNQSPIGLTVDKDGLSFVATYDGSCYEINGLSIKTNAGDECYATGLFGYVGRYGTVKNVSLVNNFDDYTIELGTQIQSPGASAYFGTLVGYNAGTITNCASAGYAIKAYSYNYSTAYVGGFVGYNAGTISNSSADSPAISVETNRSNGYQGTFAGANSGTLSSCYSLGILNMIKNDTSGEVRQAGFAGTNFGSIRNSYCAAVKVNSGVDAEDVFGFSPTGGSIRNCYFLNDGSYYYYDSVYSFDDQAVVSGVTGVTNEKMTTDVPNELKEAGFRTAKTSKYYENTEIIDPTGSYPYPAVVRDANGNYIHYGEWTLAHGFGDYGIFYWEHEVGGANEGYHLYMIFANKDTVVDTLCKSHDDGGIIEEYGYGYFAVNIDSVTPKFSNVNTGNRNTAVETELAKTMKGYHFAAYQTSSASNINSAYMYINASSASVVNATMKLTFKKTSSTSETATFAFNPFFAAAINYQSATEVPGSASNTYKIRNIDQLQYINWNYVNKNTHTYVKSDGGSSSNKTTLANLAAQIDDYTYMGYFYSDWGLLASYENHLYEKKMYWTQTHDVDADMEPNGGKYFTPIGTLYDAQGDSDSNASVVAMIYSTNFNGSFDGQAYKIKNIEINCVTPCIGMFGVTRNAELKNIIIYSDKGNTITTTDTDSTGYSCKSWYNIGGLVGFACGNQNGLIQNCSISGYSIYDKKTFIGYGGCNIGGLVGFTNAVIADCEAVNDIYIQNTYSTLWGLIGVNRYLRIGGLVGNCRNAIVNCYTGGSVDVSSLNYGVMTTIGGIMGGAYTKSDGVISSNLGNVGDFVGGSMLRVLYISNCYTYMELPGTSDDIKFCSPIGSVGNAGVSEVSMTINNCYYLGQNIHGNINQNNNRDSYAGEINSRTYAQMESADFVAELNDTNYGTTLTQRLNAVGYTPTAYHKVTVEENGGVAIPGKYSFGAGDPDLDGKNFPFAATITQVDSFGDTVYVHYGIWSKDTGLFADKHYMTLDLISAERNADGAIVGAIDYIDTLTLNCFVGGVQQAVNAGNTTVTSLNNKVSCDITPDGQSATLRIVGKEVGFDEVTVTTTAGGQKYTTTIYVEIGAEINIQYKEHQSTEDGIYQGDDMSWDLWATDHRGDIINLTAANWLATPDDNNSLTIIKSGDNYVEPYVGDDGITYYTVTTNAAKTGLASIDVKCINVPTNYPATYVDSNKLNIDLKVKTVPFIGLTDGAVYDEYNYRLKDYTENPPYNVPSVDVNCQMFVYSELDFNEWSIDKAATDISGFRDDEFYNFSFGEATKYNNTYYVPIYLQTNAHSTETETRYITVTIPATYNGVTKDLTIDYKLPDKPSQLSVRFYDSSMTLVKTTSVDYGGTVVDAVKDVEKEMNTYTWIDETLQEQSIVYEREILWYDSEAYSNLYDMSKSIKTNVDLYAKWKNQYTITLDNGDGITYEYYYDPASAAIYRTADFMIKASDFAKGDKLGNAFLAWNTAKDGTGLDVMVNKYSDTLSDYVCTLVADVEGYVTAGAWTKLEDTTLYAKFEPNKCKVLFDYNYKVDDNEVTLSTTVVYGSTSVASCYDANTVKRTGYIFDGWFTTPQDDANSVQVADASGNLIPNLTASAGELEETFTNNSGQWCKESDTTLYAHWRESAVIRFYYYNCASPFQKEIKSDANSIGAINASGFIDASKSAYTYDVAQYAKTGYEFMGWYEESDYEYVESRTKIANVDGTLISGTRFFTGDNWTTIESVNLYAAYKAHEFTLNLSNEGKAYNTATVTYDSADISYEKTYSNPTKTGYNFMGWKFGDVRVIDANNTSSLAKNVETIIGDQTTNLTTLGEGLWCYDGNKKSFDLEADYEAKKYEVIMHVAGSEKNGYTNKATVYYGSNQIDYDETYLTSTYEKKRSDYYFDGWYYKNSSGKYVKFINRDGTLVNTFTMDTDKPIEVYAKYYRVVMIGSVGASYVTYDSSLSYTLITGKTIANNSTRNFGWTFQGWYTSDRQAVTKTILDTALATNDNIKTNACYETTIYAKWSVRRYTIVTSNDDIKDDQVYLICEANSVTSSGYIMGLNRSNIGTYNRQEKSVVVELDTSENKYYIYDANTSTFTYFEWTIKNNKQRLYNAAYSRYLEYDGKNIWLANGTACVFDFPSSANINWNISANAIYHTRKDVGRYLHYSHEKDRFYVDVGNNHNMYLYKLDNRTQYSSGEGTYVNN